MDWFFDNLWMMYFWSVLITVVLGVLFLFEDFKADLKAAQNNVDRRLLYWPDIIKLTIVCFIPIVNVPMGVMFAYEYAIQLISKLDGRPLVPRRRD